MSNSRKVVIIGGGVAGISAALAARRNGIDVLLIERRTSLGGTAVAGLVGPFLGLAGGGKGIIHGNLLRILCKMRELFPQSVEAFPMI